MIERNISFTRDMALATWRGEKTQTRRVIKPQGGTWWRPKQMPNPDFIGWETDVRHDDGPTTVVDLPRRGDVMRVREPYWQSGRWLDLPGEVTPGGAQKRGFQGAGGPEFSPPNVRPVLPDNRNDVFGVYARRARFMPSRFARQFLSVLSVKVCRLQSITASEARAEGLTCCDADLLAAFADLWDLIYARRGFGWSDDPWVAALTYERIYEMPRGIRKNGGGNDGGF